MTWDWWLYFPSKGSHAVDFYCPKYPLSWVGWEPANLSSSGKHATTRPPRAAVFKICPYKISTVVHQLLWSNMFLFHILQKYICLTKVVCGFKDLLLSVFQHHLSNGVNITPIIEVCMATVLVLSWLEWPWISWWTCQIHKYSPIRCKVDYGSRQDGPHIDMMVS